jgi:S1-C subfamily serine protease
MTLLVAFALAVPSARVQDKQDDERTQRILQRIDREIRDSHARLREELRSIIRAEIQKLRAPAAPPPAPAERKKPYLGVVTDEFLDAERQALGVAGGIKIGEVRGPAQKAGLRPGDILLEIDGEPVSEERIGKILERYKPGAEVTLTVLREKRRETLKLTLGERPD